MREGCLVLRCIRRPRFMGGMATQGCHLTISLYVYTWGISVLPF